MYIIYFILSPQHCVLTTILWNGSTYYPKNMFQSHSQQADEPEVKYKFRIKDFFLFILYPVNDLKYYFSNYCHFELNWIELNVCIFFQLNDIPLWN